MNIAAYLLMPGLHVKGADNTKKFLYHKPLFNESGKIIEILVGNDITAQKNWESSGNALRTLTTSGGCAGTAHPPEAIFPVIMTNYRRFSTPLSRFTAEVISDLSYQLKKKSYNGSLVSI